MYSHVMDYHTNNVPIWSQWKGDLSNSEKWGSRMEKRVWYELNTQMTSMLATEFQESLLLFHGLTYLTVLRLVTEKVDHSGQGLTHENEIDPEDTISYNLSHSLLFR